MRLVGLIYLINKPVVALVESRRAVELSRCCLAVSEVSLLVQVLSRWYSLSGCVEVLLKHNKGY